MRFLFLPLLLAIMASCATKPTGKPNVVLIYSDDQRYNTIHALGNDEIRTPNLDRLVNEGVSFSRAHIMGGRSGALCVPSRAMLHTGRYVQNLNGAGGVIPPEHITMPEVLSAAGYATFMTGKWHNNKEALSRIYDDGDNIYLGGMHWPKDGGHINPWLNHFDSTGVFPNEEKWQHHEFSSTAFTNAALGFIDSQEGSDNPFYLYVAFSSPHDPRTPPAGFVYDTANISLPENFMEVHPFNNGEMKVRDEQLLPWPRTKAAVKQELANYYGMISEMDFQIGRILQKLEDTELIDNTIIVFAGDNGLAVGSHGLLGKQNLYDHSMRIPMIISAPGIKGNITRDGFSIIPDLFPTIAELVGMALPTGVDGRSLVSVMKEGGKVRDNVYYLYRDLQRGVRTDDNWKLIKYLVDGEVRTQLFNLNEDPMELNDLSTDPDFATKLAELEKVLSTEMKAHNDNLNPEEPYFGKEMPVIRKLNNSNKAANATITYLKPYSPKYDGGGERALIDQKLGNSEDFSIKWQAFLENDIELVLKFDELQFVSEFSLSFLNHQGAYIFLPSHIRIEGSNDGEKYYKIVEFKEELKANPGEARIKEYSTKLYPKEFRYLKITAENVGTCPDWHVGKGEPAWLFIDEIYLN